MNNNNNSIGLTKSITYIKIKLMLIGDKKFNQEG